MLILCTGYSVPCNNFFRNEMPIVPLCQKNRREGPWGGVDIWWSCNRFSVKVLIRFDFEKMYSGAFSDATIVMNRENGLPKIYVLDLFNQHGSQSTYWSLPVTLLWYLAQVSFSKWGLQSLRWLVNTLHWRVTSFEYSALIYKKKYMTQSQML